MAEIRVAVADARGETAQALLSAHWDYCCASTPPEFRHAMPADAFSAPDLTLWLAWEGDRALGCGALRDLGGAGEIKAMHTLATARGRGVGQAVLAAIIDAARARGMAWVALETGSDPAFAAARRLYQAAGFARSGPFADYADVPQSAFYRLAL